MAELFNTLHRGLYRKAESLRLTREQYVLPGVFVNKVGKDGKQELRVWDLKISNHRLFDRYRLSTAYAAKQIDFELWAKILSKYGVLPVSPFNSLAVHDLFGHAFAAIVHPYEEMVLTKRFYDRFLRELERYEGEARTRYSAMHFQAANLMFEGLEIPKSGVVETLTQWNRLSENDLRIITDSGTGMLSAEKLIAATTTLPPSLKSLLHEFRTKIVVDEARFYSSADFYGGDFYDVFNHHRKGGKITNFADDPFAVHLEGLRFRVLQSPEKLNPELMRLFVAYANASKFKIDFKSFFEAAIGSERRIGKDGVPIPFQGSVVESYLRSYSGPGFQEFLDGLFVLKGEAAQ
jgi:hypothetical protein